MTREKSIIIRHLLRATNGIDVSGKRREGAPIAEGWCARSQPLGYDGIALSSACIPILEIQSRHSNPGNPLTKRSIPALVALVLLWSAFAPPLDPPFGGTIFIDPDIMTEDDPSTLVVAVYRGQEMRTMYDRRANDWVQRNAHIIDTAYSDGLVIEVQVNPEFDSADEAREQAVRWAEEVGRLPRALRTNVQTMWIHKGTEPFGGGNQNILIHTGQADEYISDGILLETLVHEASHTSLDPLYAADPGWLAAQQADPEFISTYARDYPNREDIAESFLTWLAVRHRADRIPASMKQTIESTIPNRLAFFDQLNLDLSPLVTGTSTEIQHVLPREIVFEAPYPNPFSDSTTLTLQLDAPQTIEVDVFDLSGRQVRSIGNRALNSGSHMLSWDGRSDEGRRASPGVYFIRIIHGQRADIQKVVLK